MVGSKDPLQNLFEGMFKDMRVCLKGIAQEEGSNGTQFDHGLFTPHPIAYLLPSSSITFHIKS